MPLTVFFISLLLINVFAYAVMWQDKKRAIQKRRRIPEKRLFLIALCLGATGIYAGMKKPLYHKAAKSSFKFGIPFLIVINLALIIYFIRLMIV